MFYEKLAHAQRVDKVLIHAQKYLAHLPRKEGNGIQDPETLAEHMDLVLEYVEQLCTVHGLDQVIERLVSDVVSACRFKNANLAKDNLLDLFLATIAFHDFGKINEFFQADKMKNADPIFGGKNPELFKPRSGHSELGAFIFSVYQLERINTLEGLEDDDKVKLSALALFFSNSILLHHSPKLDNPNVRVLRSQFLTQTERLEKYLRCYDGFPKMDITSFYFENLKDVLEQFEGEKVGFSLFALLRLNFSLLTAADYLATGAYSYDLKLENENDWGVFSGERRNAVTNAPRTNLEKSYNIDAYNLKDQIRLGTAAFQDPQEASEPNLNILRTEMAVRMLETLEKHHDKRLFYLEAPTGGGKTNLSMLAVAEMLRADASISKVFYVFPFTTLITQTHKAILETLLLTDNDMALLHGRAGFQTAGAKGDDEESDALYGPQRKDFLQNLFALYPLTLVTHIRFFDILKSNRKDDIYLMHRLANSIVVLDELQSYPPKHWDKMLYLLDQYGKYFNIRFILMSATLPRLTEIEAVKRNSDGLPEVIDLLPDAKHYFQNENFRGRVTFKFDLLERGDITLEELSVSVLEKSRARAQSHHGRVFTIVEFIFKKSATEFKMLLENQEPYFDEILVLSGTILESRRRQIIHYLKNNRHTPNLKVLLITTQVVEAGVDIDMDLGFKNTSLIDSDEQLAGRVNRNVGKKDCEVWLFRKDDPTVIYGNDLRFKISKDLPQFHREVLESKDFGKLYGPVFDKIEQNNQSAFFENLNDYINHFHKLDFPKIDSSFRLIEQKTLSVFVPVPLPISIAHQNEVKEPFFNNFEIDFLQRAMVIGNAATEVDGEAVWRFYRELLANQNEDFIAKKIEQKVVQGILAKFTFSLFDSPKNREKLWSNSHKDLSLDDYFYLHRWKEDDIYRIESGLDEAKMEDPIL